MLGFLCQDFLYDVVFKIHKKEDINLPLYPVYCNIENGASNLFVRMQLWVSRSRFFFHKKKVLCSNQIMCSEYNLNCDANILRVGRHFAYCTGWPKWFLQQLWCSHVYFNRSMNEWTHELTGERTNKWMNVTFGLHVRDFGGMVMSYLHDTSSIRLENSSTVENIIYSRNSIHSVFIVWEVGLCLQCLRWNVRNAVPLVPKYFKTLIMHGRTDKSTGTWNLSLPCLDYAPSSRESSTSSELFTSCCVKSTDLSYSHALRGWIITWKCVRWLCSLMRHVLT